MSWTVKAIEAIEASRRVWNSIELIQVACSKLKSKCYQLRGGRKLHSELHNELHKTVRTPCCCGSKCAGSVININLSSLTTIVHFGDITLTLILHKDLFMMPCKVQLTQELKAIDHSMLFCCDKCACDGLTEEADFDKNNQLFKWSSVWSWQIFSIRGTENPHAYIENLTHPKRVIVWCGF